MSATAPIGAAERIGELDVLRGFALLGVFIVHFVGSGFYELPIGEAAQAAFLEDPVNRVALFITEYFFYDKANTLFAALFGAGFWVMMERLSARGAAFGAIYARRLAVLFVIGAANLALLFPGDVLHEYAALGVILLLLRGLPRAAFLALGLVLALAGDTIAAHLLPGADAAYAQFDKLQEATFRTGDYGAWVTVMFPAHIEREVVNGAFLGWGLYIFGRFLLGAWVIRQGWIQRTGEILPQVRRAALVLLPLGLAVELAGMSVYLGWVDLPAIWDTAFHAVGALALAGGYACALILLFHSRWRPVAAWFAPVGKMALTAYVLHGAVFSVLLFPFGLGLAGTITPAGLLLFAVVLFIALCAFCRWWLERWRFGPLEYLWRWATYGERPRLAVR